MTLAERYGESGKHLVARLGLVTESLLQATGGSEISMVAGAGYGLFLAFRCRCA
jgi:hypothetical protein